MERANWTVLYQLRDLEKECYKNKIFIFSYLFQKFSAVYDFENHCIVLTGQLPFVTGRDILQQQYSSYTHAHTHTHTCPHTHTHHSFITWSFLRHVHSHFHNEFSLLHLANSSTRYFP